MVGGTGYPGAKATILPFELISALANETLEIRDRRIVAKAIERVAFTVQTEQG